MNAAWCLSGELLKYVRDERPSEEAIVAKFGHEKYHTLRKAGLLRLQRGHVTLSKEHTSKDGKQFRFENQLFFLDEDRVLTFR